MNARVRMMADARSLFWPWSIVAAAGILSLFSWPRFPGGLEMEVVAGIGFCIGVPLLATLSFGNEFQFGTFSSLLSQPIERSRIWREKSAVIVLAVLSAAIAYGFGASRMGWEIDHISVAALWLMVTVGSSAYWTLVARSTIGGLVFNGLQSMAFVLAFVPLLNNVEAYAIRPAADEILLAIGSFATAYTAIMLYLGRRKLLRFQVTGTGSNSNLLATDWALAPNPVRRLLRCTASGGTLNLVRKEFHLLWPLVPMTLIAMGMLLAVAPLRFVSSWIMTAGISIILIHGLFAAILAGTLSLGEERTLGLHAWNMTQPVSVFRQWAIKLVTAVLAGVACTGAVVLMTHLLLGPDFPQQFAAMFPGHLGMFSLTIFPLLTVVAFWCATGVNGTVRAVFWCLPAAAAVLVAYGFGVSTGMTSNAVELVRTVTEAVHPFPFSVGFETMARNLMWSEQRSVVVPALWLILWLLPPAALQSYRLFRSEVREGIRPLIRQALVLMGIAFLSGFLQIVPAAADRTMLDNTVGALAELSQGVTAMRIDPTVVSEAGYTVSLGTISGRTRAWLATDTLVIRPMGAVARNGIPELEEARYRITAQLHGGWKCAFANNLFEVNRRISPYMFACKAKQGTLGWLEVDP
jgi:hypothetical protein